MSEGQTVLVDDPVRLLFARNEAKDAYSKTVHRGTTEYLDIMVAFESARAVLPLKENQYKLPASYVAQGFDFIADKSYTLKIEVVGDNAEQPLRLSAVFNWTGNWETARLVVVTSSPTVSAHPSGQSPASAP